MKTGFVFLVLCIAASLGNAQNCNRAAIVNDYIQSINNTVVSTAELNWTGSVAGCNPGTISSSAIEKTLIRINYFRCLVGVRDTIKFRADYDQKCQEAALMMRANNSLNHNPPANWICYTAGGKEAAAKAKSELCIALLSSNTGKYGRCRGRQFCSGA